jgi:hypothetical protein
MEKVKVVHWKHIIGDDLPEILDIMKAYDDLARYGRSSHKIPPEADENYRRKIWQCRQEGWYPRYRNGAIEWMHLIPGDDYVGTALSESSLDTRDKRREYIAKRDVIHVDTNYQDRIERDYYEGIGD